MGKIPYQIYGCQGNKNIFPRDSKASFREKLGMGVLPCHSAGMKKSPLPSRSQFAVLRQICSLDPFSPDFAGKKEMDELKHTLDEEGRKR
jgi:hypothetical protein